MAWFEFHLSLPEHPKVMKLESLLGIDNPQVIGHLCRLWAWVMDKLPDGDISATTPQMLCRAAMFDPKRAEEFLDALIKAGFIDRRGEQLMMHEWEDYGGKYFIKKQKNAIRRRRQREALALCADEAVACDRTATDAHVAYIEERREEESREEDRREEYFLRGGDDEEAQGRIAQFHEYLMGRSLVQEDFLNATEEDVDKAKELTDSLFEEFCSRSPTEYDHARVFAAVWDGKRLDPRRQDLLSYAFETAAAAGKGGKWTYIEGVLGRLWRRGIKDLSTAEIYDFERKETPYGD